MSFSAIIGRFQIDDPAPLYAQLQYLIRDAITRKILVRNDAIPAERELAIEYDVSRVTIRRAISSLVEEGLLTRRRGSGTFVSAPTVKTTSKLVSFSEELIARGKVPSSVWLNKTRGIVTAEESLLLGLSPGSGTYRFHRIRYADGVVISVEHSTIIENYLPSRDSVQSSIYLALQAAGNRPVRAVQRVRAVNLGAEHSKMLGVLPGHAGLFIERRGFLGDGRAVEFTRSYYRGDMYDLIAELTAG